METRTDSYKVKCTPERKLELMNFVKDPLIYHETLTGMVETAVDMYVNKFKPIPLKERTQEIFNFIRRNTDSETLKNSTIKLQIIYYNNWKCDLNNVFTPMNKSFYSLYDKMSQDSAGVEISVVPYMYIKQDALFGWKIEYIYNNRFKIH